MPLPATHPINPKVGIVQAWLRRGKTGGDFPQYVTDALAEVVTVCTLELKESEYPDIQSSAESVIQAAHKISEGLGELPTLMNELEEALYDMMRAFSRPV